jgi:hypothetical protein
MPNVASSPHKDTAVSFNFPLLIRCQWYRTKHDPHDFILSNIKYKSHQIILEGIAHE